MDTTDATFESDVLMASGLILVDFWAEWCPPCHALTPTLEALEGEFPDKVKVVKINADENPETAANYGVRGLPTVILFKDGEAVARLAGAQPKKNYVEAIKRHA